MFHLTFYLIYTLALVDGIARESNGKSIYVASSERMQLKVLQLARYTTDPTLILTSVKFPRIDNQYLLDGPAVLGVINQPTQQIDDELYIYDETRLFYHFKKLTSKFVDNSIDEDFIVDFKFRIGSNYSQTFNHRQTFKIKKCQDKGEYLILSYRYFEILNECSRIFILTKIFYSCYVT